MQQVTLRLKDGRTRLYFWAHGKGAVRYLAADSEDGCAYPQNFKHLRLTKHTHHPVDDAKGNAEVLLTMKEQMSLPPLGKQDWSNYTI